MSASRTSSAAPFSRALTIVLFLLIGALIVGGIIAIAFELDDDPFGKILGTIALLALCDAAMLTSILVTAKRASRIWLTLPGALFVAGGSFLLMALMMYERSIRFSTEELMGWGSAIGIAAGVALLHTSVFLNIRARVLVVRIPKALSICAVWMSVMCLGSAAAFDMSSSMNWGVVFLIGFLMGIAVLVAVAGTIITPILALNSVNRKRADDETLSAEAKMTMTCPGCANEMTARRGVNRCPICRARCFVEFEEPRCACGYPLYKLAGRTCPECGSTVPVAAPVSSGPA